MGEVLGDILGNAVGVAVSPLPLVAAIMLLMAPGGRTKGASFVVGWLVGLTVVFAVFTALGPLASGDDPGLVASVFKLVLGVLFLLLAVRTWRSRDAGDGEPPAWMTRVQESSVGACVGFGVALAAANPKNLGLTAAAGGTVGAADLTTGDAVVVGAAFVVIASSVMLGILGGAVLVPDRSGPALERLREWLVLHNSAVMMVVLLLMGSKLIGDALRGLS